MPNPSTAESTGGRLAARCRITALVALSAVLIALSLPQDNLSLLSWLCLVPLLVAIRSCRTARGAALAIVPFVLIFGGIFARWLPGTIATFFRLSLASGWLGALAVYASFGIIPIGLFAALTHRLLHCRSPWRILAGVPAIWVATELLRVHLLDGLPWALLGHALYRQPVLIQVADLGGVFAVSFVIASVNAGLFLALTDARRWWSRLAPVAISVALVASSWLYGTVRMAQVNSTGESAIAVGILQPNRPPVYHWTRMAADRELISYLRLTTTYFAGRDVDLVVWPENAIPLYPERDSRLEARLASLADSVNASLIIGAPGAATPGAVGAPIYNAAHMIEPSAGLVATYRKQRLVPFAEYQPGPREATASDGGASAFAPGSGPVIFTINGVRWGPTICLDFVFADVVRRTVRAGAELLVNLSNDSWLTSGGPGAPVQQHVQAVFRAVENRRDVVRATTTGISAAINAAGVPLAYLREGKAGSLIARVTPRNAITIYTRSGDLFSLACVAVGVLVTVAGKRRDPIPSQETPQRRTERVGFEPTRG